MSLENGLDQRLRLARLCDIYGGLLTPKQQDCLRLLVYEDLSLREAGEELGVSRQAVYDLVRRVEQTLERFEGKLRLLERRTQMEDELRQAAQLVRKGEGAAALALLEKWSGAARGE